VLKNGLWRTERRGKATEREMGQNGKFSEMENPISLAKEDDDLVPIFFL
jgi:hypothetical protein